MSLRQSGLIEKIMEIFMDECKRINKIRLLYPGFKLCFS